MSTVEHRFFLCDASPPNFSMDQIAELKVYSRQYQLQLNAWGTVSCWSHLLDPNSALVVNHQTALRCDRDNEPIWSGPIYKTNETTAATSGSQSGQDQLQITAIGWLQQLNMRLVHTGAEFTDMLAAPNGVAWQAENGTYTSPAVDEATTLSYSATTNPAITDAVIIFDLLDRANIDAPTGITRGNVYGSPVQRNLTLQRLQNVWQQIDQLVNVESGCDVYVDPVTLQMHLFGPGASPSPTIANGMGVDRGQGTLFSLPGNCVNATRSRDGTQTANRDYAIGQYGVGRADSITSQQQNGLFESSDQLSEVVDENILIAYANVEITVRQYPWTIIGFTPRAVSIDDESAPGVPIPFTDYFLGDIVYSRVDRGSMQVGTSEVPQATRVFGFTASVDDNGIERLSSIATTYQGLS